MDPQNLFIDIATGQVQAGNVDTSAPSVRAIVGTALALRVGFVSGAVPQELDVAVSGMIVFKKPLQHASLALFVDAEWTQQGVGAATRYLFSALVSGDGLTAWMEGKDQSIVMAQIEFTLATEAAPRRSLPFPVTVCNSYITGEESASPAPAMAKAPRFYPTITALTGGDPTDFDSVATAILPVPTVALLFIGEELQFWVLRAGTTAPDGIGYVRGTDYAGGTNEKFWERKA